VIAVDTNVLVYAHRRDSPWHEAARLCLQDLAEGNSLWAIPWPCVHEFLANVTHPRIYRSPTPLETAFVQLEAWLESPNLVMLGESEGYLERLRNVTMSARVMGPRVHDARIAAICLQHGVRELWSADRDFGRFPSLRVCNPLVG